MNNFWLSTDFDKLFDAYQYFDSNIKTLNLKEEDEQFIVEVSVPGYKKDEIKMNFENDLLSISAKIEKKEGETSWKKSFKKEYTINKNVDVDNINAKLEDGILKVILPKAQSSKLKAIEIT